MNLAEVKEKLYDLTAMFFGGAAIIWAEQINTKPLLPYVMLKCGGINRTAFTVNDGEGRRVYHARTTWEVNLFTKGQPKTAGAGITGNNANTATSDLMEFANFIESEGITDIIAGYGMDVTLMPPVRDASELQNDSKYRYRAIAEFTVSFAQEANGSYGLGGVPLVPNSSGGGCKEMGNVETETIETIEITEGGNDDEE